MKSRLLEFIERLRAAGLRISPSETLDASRALGVFGIEPSCFREAMAATLVKDESDRDTFEHEFDRFFAIPARSKAKRSPKAGTAEQRGVGRQRDSPGTSISASDEQRHSPQDSKRPSTDRRSYNRQRSEERQGTHRRKPSDLRRLADAPLHELTPRQIEACDVLLRRLAAKLQGRASRRSRRARHGRLDLRRTLRRSISAGGVPLWPEFRRRRPGKPDLVALCDLSYSVSVAARFLLSLVNGAPALFRRVRLFGYVDVPTEIWLQDGHIVHDEPVDFYARSDFGSVLRSFWESHASLLTRSTLLLVLGDARNNRRPPRADLLRRMASVSQRTVWLNPEPQGRWNTGDSVLAAYARDCDTVISAGTIRELYVALRALTR